MEVAQAPEAYRVGTLTGHNPPSGLPVRTVRRPGGRRVDEAVAPHKRDRWRVAADADKDAWPTTFRAFVEDRLAVLDACRANINATLQGGEPPQSST